jgi:hypothetical protein
VAKQAYKKYSRDDQKLLATWAADCALRVLPLFESRWPEDCRPRDAIKSCRTWVRTGVFKMAEIRGASLGAHAAARAVKETGDDVACFAARAAGQAVATSHVPQHAYGGALYALKAIAAADRAQAEKKVAKERNWQSRRLPEKLREAIMSRIVVLNKKSGIQIKIVKDQGF